MKLNFDSQTIINVALVVAAIAFLSVIIWGINRLFKVVYKKVSALAGTKIKGLEINNYKILDPNYAAKLIVGGLKVLRVLVLLVVVYFWLPLLFSIFPWTEDIAKTLLEYTLTPLSKIGNSLIDFLPNLFFIVIALIITKNLSRILKYFSGEIEKEKLRINGFHKDWSRPTYIIFKLILYVFALVVIFPYLPGSDSPAFQGISIFMGVLLSLGSTAFVSNAVGGLMIIYMRPFVVGDVIKVGDKIGTVISKNMLVTRIKTPKNEDISVPNKMIVDNEITNYSSEDNEKGVFLHTTVTIGYDVPWRKVHEVMIEAANRTELILKNPKPFVFQTALNDFSVAYEINGYTNEAAKMGAIYSELHQNLQDCFNENEIEILSPHYRVQRVSNETTIPEQYRKSK